MTQQEFESLLRRSTPPVSLEAVGSRVAGSRRRCPVELSVFQKLPADSRFSAEEWNDWRRLILKAISELDESSFQISREIISSYVDGAANRDRPMSMMIGQLERDGFIEINKLRYRFIVTPQGEEFLRREKRVDE